MPDWDKIKENHAPKALSGSVQFNEEIWQANKTRANSQNPADTSLNQASLKTPNLSAEADGRYSIDKAYKQYTGKWREGSGCFHAYIVCPQSGQGGAMAYRIQMDLPANLPDQALVFGHSRTLRADGQIDTTSMYFTGSVRKNALSGALTYTGTLYDRLTPNLTLTIPGITIELKTETTSLATIEKLKDMSIYAQAKIIPYARANNEFAFSQWMNNAKRALR